MPNQAKEIYQDDYIKLRWNMSNSEIMKRINDALSDKEKLSEMSNRVRQRYFEANMDMPNYTIKLNKIFEDVLNPKPKMKTHIFYHLYIADTPVWQDILKVQFDSIVNSGLYDEVNTIYFGDCIHQRSRLVKTFKIH